MKRSPGRKLIRPRAEGPGNSNVFHRLSLEKIKPIKDRKTILGIPWKWHGVVVLFIAAVCYYPSLRGKLVFDDIAALKENRDIRPYAPLINLFMNDFWGTPIQKEQSHKSYRPLTVLSFRWNYWIHGLNPKGYHVINIIMHAIASYLYLKFCRLVLSSEVAMISALFFAVHPIHTDAVASVVGRAEMLSAIFFLATLIWYWRQVAAHKAKPYKRAWVPILPCVVLAAMGTLSKEQSLTSLIICMVADFFVLNKVPLRLELIVSMVNLKSKAPVWYRSAVIRVRFLLLSFLLLLGIRMYIMGQHLPYFNRFDNPSSVASTDTKALTYNLLMALNAWLMLCPSSLACDWSSDSVPLVTAISDVRNLGTVFLYIVVLALLYKSISQGISAVRLGLLLMIIPFLPASNLFFPVGFVIAERVLYLPSLGFCMLIAHGWSVLHGKCKSKTMVNVALTFLLVLHAARTTRRCFDWESEYTLFKSGVEANPRNVKLLNNLGRILEKWGQTEKAVPHYITALSVHPDDVTGYLNLGSAYTSLQRFQDAEKAYQMATSYLPKPTPDDKCTYRVTVNHLKVLLRLATLISRNASRLDEADQLYAQAISLRTDFSEAYVGWGSLMLRTNRTREAEFVLGKALQQDGENPNMLYNFGIVLMEQGKVSEALEFFDRALSIDPYHEPSLLTSARLIQDSGILHLNTLALSRLHQLVENGQGDATVFFSLAMLSVRKGERARAEALLREALKLQPEFPEALFNMALLLYNNERPSEALEFVESLLQLKHDHVKGLMLLGDIHVNYGDNMEIAEQCYKKILGINPKNYQSLHNLCVVYLKRHELEQAADCFRKAMALAPNVDYIQKHLQLTETLMENEKNAFEQEFMEGEFRIDDEASALPHD